MQKCTACNADVERVAVVSVLMPGKTDDIQNTQEIARICNDCVELVLTRALVLIKPEGALNWQDFL